VTGALDQAPSVLSHAFAVRAEQLRDRIFDLYQEPGYFPELVSDRSCVLVGGRGSGKTTVLRGLSYQGQHALGRNRPVAEWPYYGFYLRIHTGRVMAFAGPGLPEPEWQPLFAHYANVLLCELVLEFLTWFEEHTNIVPAISQDALSEVIREFGTVGSAFEGELSTVLANRRSEIEQYVNNVRTDDRPTLSMIGRPLDALLKHLRSEPHFRDKSFYFLIDEYENFTAPQQQVFNTLIKHAGEDYCFKIGMKELGWRRRSTLNATERLQAPADYALIDIADRLSDPGVFVSFAARICNERLSEMGRELGLSSTPDVWELFPRLTEDEEAVLLDVGDHVDRILTRAHEASIDVSGLASERPLLIYLLEYWDGTDEEGLRRNVAEFYRDPALWQTRLGNYQHSLLYTLRSGKRGIRKLYAGFDTLVELAGANTRYLVQLVEEILRRRLARSEDPTDWLLHPVAPTVQTAAAKAVAERNLVELEGLSLIGPRITRLVMGLGRVFQVMAMAPKDHTPEITQFRITDLPENAFSEADDRGDWSSVDEVTPHELVREAVIHLALVRLVGTKLSAGYVRDPDYMLHPLFSALFNYSYRKKRKMSISANDLMGLVNAPKATVEAILARTGRDLGVLEASLEPDQLLLFDRYFNLPAA
jgi:hypothetical protein